MMNNAPDQATTVQPQEDESLPPQLREALRIVARRGPVVELTCTATLGAPQGDTGEVA